MAAIFRFIKAIQYLMESSKYRSKKIQLFISSQRLFHRVLNSKKQGNLSVRGYLQSLEPAKKHKRDTERKVWLLSKRLQRYPRPGSTSLANCCRWWSLLYKWVYGDVRVKSKLVVSSKPLQVKLERFFVFYYI